MSKQESDLHDFVADFKKEFKLYLLKQFVS